MIPSSTGSTRRQVTRALALVLSLAWAAPAGAGQRPGDDPDGCRVGGIVRSGDLALPGVWLVVRVGESDEPMATTSTRRDGTWDLQVPPGAAYQLTATLAGFVPQTRELVVAATCTQPAAPDLQMVLPAEARVGPADLSAWTPPRAPDTSRLEWEWEFADAALELGLPPGFWSDRAPQTIAIVGDELSVDRGRLRTRQQAVARGEITLVTTVPLEDGLPASLFDDPPGEAPSLAAASESRPAGRGGGAGGGGGRTVTPQRAYNATIDYTLRGSMLESAPYQLRPERPAEKRPYTRQSFSLTAGGPLAIPGVYEGGRRTNFTLTYSGDRGSNLFDQYSTVPPPAVRAGDFSDLPFPLIDPATGDAFPDNRIPDSRMHPSALALLRFIPEPNLPGTSRNFQYTTTRESITDNMNLRLTHQFGAQPQARGGRGGGAGGRAGGGTGGGTGGAADGPEGAEGRRPVSATLNAQVQVRRNQAEQVNAFPELGGANRGTTVTVPVSLNLQHGRDVHAVSVNVSRTTNHTGSRYAFVENIAGLAGITGVADDPYAWGMPSLTFSTYSSARDVNPSVRQDARVTLGYSWTRPVGSHSFKWGADSRTDRSSNVTDANARGTFVFTGQYVAAGRRLPRGTGADFADFLLGLPQQASVQFGPGQVQMRGQSLSLYLQDDWRRSANLTLNLGVRYEMVWPFFEAGGQMVNLDVSPDFGVVAPVVAGEEGPFSGAFPRGMVRADTNNIAPRLGLAWKAPRDVTVRSGYNVSFNSGTYSNMARRLVGQPPFAATQTATGSLDDPIDFYDPFVDASLVPTANNFGVNRDYTLGVVHTWNLDLSRQFRSVWTLSGSYTGKKGSSLDIMRAPNRDPRAQGFQWQSSDGRSMMHGGTFRLQRRKAKGWSSTITYTLARSRDNMATAQDDEDLDAEWARSNNDRRHQLSVNANLDLPFGEGQRWRSNGGVAAALLANWTTTATLTTQSGTPLTPRVTGAQAAGRQLRADYTGEPISLPSPGIDQFFNSAAFVVPERGQLGTAGRNMIPGPGSALLNATIARDLKVGGPRVLTVRLTANNLLNLVNYNAVNTTVNSPAFGQITSVRPMRTMTLNFRLKF
jgi:trimeric autotransporter adhesin